jgi:hypothetical protein
MAARRRRQLRRAGSAFGFAALTSTSCSSTGEIANHKPTLDLHGGVFPFRGVSGRCLMQLAPWQLPAVPSRRWPTRVHARDRGDGGRRRDARVDADSLELAKPTHPP